MTENKAKHTALDISKYFIWKASEGNKVVTNKKIQKLVYYAQAWFLVATTGSKDLFNDTIEAWIHGPVIPSLYHTYKSFGFHGIDHSLGEKNNFDPEIKRLLDEVWNVYGNLDANTLEALSHSELPWQEARNSTDRNEFGDIEISRETMLTFYSSLKKQLEHSNKEFPFSDVVYAK